SLCILYVFPLFLFYFVSLLFVVFCSLLSFPTQRSSDLGVVGVDCDAHPVVLGDFTGEGGKCQRPGNHVVDVGTGKVFCPTVGNRSEEHTSELQSRFDLVCRLLLEKQKQINELPSSLHES